MNGNEIIVALAVSMITIGPIIYLIYDAKQKRKEEKKKEYEREFEEKISHQLVFCPKCGNMSPLHRLEPVSERYVYYEQEDIFDGDKVHEECYCGNDQCVCVTIPDRDLNMGLYYEILDDLKTDNIDKYDAELLRNLRDRSAGSIYENHHAAEALREAILMREFVFPYHQFDASNARARKNLWQCGFTTREEYDEYMRSPAGIKAEEEDNERLEARKRKKEEEYQAKHPTPAPAYYSPPKMYTPRCPICNSPDIKKITITRDIVNTAVFGTTAAAVRHRQWHCNSCGSEF